MAISKTLGTFVSTLVSWAMEYFNKNRGSSKKELELPVSVLKKKLEELAAASGNTELVKENADRIMRAALDQLTTEKNIGIFDNIIIFIYENKGSVDVTKSTISGSSISGDVVSKKQGEKLDVSKIFDGVDEEIAHSRATKPSDRR